jgi:hypothetical protein
MRPLKDWQFDPKMPLQTKRGAAQALRVGQDKVDELIEGGHLELGSDSLGDRIKRVTTKSILKLANDQPEQDSSDET